ADIPATSEAGVERQSTVNQSYRRTYVLAEISEGERGVHKCGRIVVPHLQSAAGEIGSLTGVQLHIFAAAILAASKVSGCGTGERGPLLRITLDSSLDEGATLPSKSLRRTREGTNRRQ